MPQLELAPLHRQDVPIGVPMHFPLFDAHHTLLLSEGQCIQNEQQLDSLLEIGIYRASNWQIAHHGGHPASDLHHEAAAHINTFAQLKLQPGASLHLRIADENSDGYAALKLLGWQDKDDLIVSATDRSGTTFAPPPGTLLEGKLLAGKGIATFKTIVRSNCTSPYPYLHLTYPETMEVRQLRKNLRVTVTLAARASSNQDAISHECSIANLSACGGMLELPQLFARIGDELLLLLSLPAAGQEHTLALRAIVRNLHTHGDTHPVVRYGLEFMDTAAAERLVVEHYIFQMMLEH